METQGTETAQKGGEKCPIDVKKWLLENKLMKLCDIFSKRNVKIEELCEFEDNELKQLSKDIKLDILDTKRFIKAIHKLQKKLGIEPATYIICKISSKIKNENFYPKLYDLKK